MRTKIALATPPTISQRTAEETLALEYLATVIRNAGYEAAVIDSWLRGIESKEAVDSMFKGRDTSVICMSCYRSNLDQASEVVRLAKSRAKNMPAICGGYGPTFHDEEFLKAGFDIAVRGEAEAIFAKLISVVLGDGNLLSVPGISFIRDGKIVRTERAEPVANLDELPFPDRDEMQYVIRRKNPVHICTSRGCNGNCAFCSIAAFNKGVHMARWRGRTIRNIVDEIKSINERFGSTHFKFVDDSFIEPPRDEIWAGEFADAITNTGLNIRFRTQVRADRLTERFICELKRCGWFATNVGAENFSNSALARMKKPVRAADNFRTLELLWKHGIYTQIGMIMFDDLTTIQELADNYQALLRCDWVVIKGVFTEMFAAKGTAFATRLENADMLGGGGLSQNFTYEIRDPATRRAYAMLKAWHKSHAALYDKVIDPITAPKVMTDNGYREVHGLCTKLLEFDVHFFGKVISQITNDPSDDAEMVASEIRDASNAHMRISEMINGIYAREGLLYDGSPNPFLA